MNRRSPIFAVLLAFALAIGGCASTAVKPGPSDSSIPATSAETIGEQNTKISNTDPCAMQLHDICGALLLYYAQNHQLPARLEELRKVPGFENSLDLNCPASGKPYLYNPIGIISAENKQRIILYDPAPSHSKMRWAVSIIEPENDAPLITKVIALPESAFTLKLPG